LGKPSEQKITPGILPTLRGAKWWGKLDKFIYEDLIREELESAVTSKSSIKDNDEVELNSCVIKSKEDFNIPEIEVSSLEKLDLNIRFAVQAKDYKKLLKKTVSCCIKILHIHLLSSKPPLLLSSSNIRIGK
jgi:hypothetical protein